jgi:polysaccharide chain length determinant protein (PEP-CTERM system associated)
VNSLVRLYIRENVSLKRGESNDATTFLSEQMANLRSNLEQTESRVNAYKRENSGIISRDEGKLFEEINTAQQKLYDLQLRRRQLEGMRVITRKSNDPLQAKLAALQKKLQDLRVQYTDSYPEVVSVKGDVETVNQQLQARKGESQPLDPHELARIESEIGAIEMTEAGLQQYVAANRKVLQSIPSAKAGLEKLQLEQSNQKAVYDQLFSRHGQSELSTQMEVQDKSTRFRVIDPAVLPVKPVSPDRLKIMLLGIIGSIAASFGLLVLLDMLDDSVKEVESAKQLGLPILAIIPKMEEPALVARQRRRFLLFSIAAAAYFLIILCLPAMELLRLPYMDQLVDQLSSARP